MLHHITHRFPGLLPSLLAWGICRGGMHLVQALDSAWWAMAQGYGAPLWKLLGAAVPGWLVAVVGELLLCGGAWCVTQCVRKDTLPQTAERAVWLWAICPLWLLVPPGGPWAWGIGLMTLSLGLLHRERAFLAALLGALAVCIRPECVVFVPAVWWIGQRALGSPRHAWWHSWCAPMALLFGLLLSVTMALGFAGSLGISIRDFYPDLWRPPWEATPLVSAQNAWVVAGTAAMGTLMGRHRALMTDLALGLPALGLLWFVGEPALVAPLCLCVYPFFGSWSKSLEVPLLERVTWGLCAFWVWGMWR